MQTCSCCQVSCNNHEMLQKYPHPPSPARGCYPPFSRELECLSPYLAAITSYYVRASVKYLSCKRTQKVLRTYCAKAQTSAPSRAFPRLVSGFRSSCWRHPAMTHVGSRTSGFIRPPHGVPSAVVNWLDAFYPPNYSCCGEMLSIYMSLTNVLFK